MDAAVDSIGANLEKCAGRKNPEHGNTELIRYARPSYGSTCEVEYRIGCLDDREVIPDAAFERLNDRMG